MILYTSDIKTQHKDTLKTAFVYLLISLFCVLFGAVYEYFSHEVYSGYMIYAFIFSMISAGAFLAICLLPLKKYPGAIARNLYHSGIATLTVGSIIRGVLDIYGTTNSLDRLYWIAGVVLLVAGIVGYLIELK